MSDEEESSQNLYHHHSLPSNVNQSLSSSSGSNHTKLPLSTDERGDKGDNSGVSPSLLSTSRSGKRRRWKPALVSHPNPEIALKIGRVMSNYNTVEELVGKKDKTPEEKQVRRILVNRISSIHSRIKKETQQATLKSSNEDLASQLLRCKQTIRELIQTNEEQDVRALEREERIGLLQSRLSEMENLLSDRGAASYSERDQQGSPSFFPGVPSQGPDDLWSPSNISDSSCIDPALLTQDIFETTYNPATSVGQPKA
ncbi:hypothetical protein B9479_007793 [Cryptococcus floricola]|uniref:Uncharacterized protein n=1 Tax=Cryptococcus floricola TaxID=2591691 RepID=A0A5D3ANG4_9TREE|nr:hypothetical protein B9479_007793 [Cryptococcus floricola]